MNYTFFLIYKTIKLTLHSFNIMAVIRNNTPFPVELDAPSLPPPQAVKVRPKEITKKEVLNRFMVIPSLKESTIVYC